MHFSRGHERPTRRRPPNAYVEVCAKAPTETTLSATVTATGGSLFVTSPFQLTAIDEVHGDPTQSCVTVWTIALDDEEIIDLTATIDSIPAGLEVESAIIFGGLDGGGDFPGADSVTTRHDAVTGATILFDLGTSP